MGSEPGANEEGHDALGVMVDLMREVAAGAGYDFEPIPMPLPRVQLGVQGGEVDGMCKVVTPARLPG